jgi:hypothetical protein
MLFQPTVNYSTYLRHSLSHMAAYDRLFITNGFPFVYREKHLICILIKRFTQVGMVRKKPSGLSASGIFASVEKYVG